MGKFKNTRYMDTIDNIVNATKDKLNNPYYIFNDKKPTKVTYYSQSIERSTLDEASGLYGSHLGADSPFKFNKIIDFLLYGIDRIETQYDNGDNGIEAAPITGQAIVLPNTIIPRPGDFFSIKYIKEEILFKINSVTVDTLDTGANIYQVEYQAELTNSISSIDKQTECEYDFIATNIGTDFKTIIRSTDFRLVKELEVFIEELITVFTNIFFNSKLQTFVYNHDGWHMYDPFMIEFLIRNKVLNFGDEYIYVSHAAGVNKTFAMDYNKTFFRSLELGTQANLNKCPNTIATADLITDVNSLFVTRTHKYYSVQYIDNSPYKTRFSTIDMDVFEHIRDNKKYAQGDNKELYNLWVSYFNDEDISFITSRLLDIIKNIEYMDNLNYFYTLGISIFILEKSIMNIMARDENK